MNTDVYLLRRSIRGDTYSISTALYYCCAYEMPVTAEQVSAKLKEALDATDVTVIDTSGGCGASFDVAVVSDKFEGKMLIARHRLVHDALHDLMPDIHALSIKRCWTKAQQEAATQQPAPVSS